MSSVLDSLMGLIESGRRKDGAATARANLEQTWDYPSLVASLPYRYYDEKNELFINTGTAGFVLELAPLPGAPKTLHLTEPLALIRSVACMSVSRGNTTIASPAYGITGIATMMHRWGGMCRAIPLGSLAASIPMVMHWEIPSDTQILPVDLSRS